MTRGFLGDDERYLDSYWRTLPGLWVHGDFAMRDEDGLVYILGRSDDTLKVAGKRVGIIVSGGNVDLDALPWSAAGGRS